MVTFSNRLKHVERLLGFLANFLLYAQPEITTANQWEVGANTCAGFKGFAQDIDEVLFPLGAHALDVVDLLVEQIRVQVNHVFVVLLEHTVHALALFTECFPLGI